MVRKERFPRRSRNLRPRRKRCEMSKLERDILKKSGEHLLQERQVIYHFVLRNKHCYPVGKMCKCMRVSKNSYYYYYYYWLRNKDFERVEAMTETLKKRIDSILSKAWKSMVAIVSSKNSNGRSNLFSFLYSITDEGNTAEIGAKKKIRGDNGF